MIDHIVVKRRNFRFQNRKGKKIEVIYNGDFRPETMVISGREINNILDENFSGKIEKKRKIHLQYFRTVHITKLKNYQIPWLAKKMAHEIYSLIDIGEVGLL